MRLQAVRSVCAKQSHSKTLRQRWSTLGHPLWVYLLVCVPEPPLAKIVNVAMRCFAPKPRCMHPYGHKRHARVQSVLKNLP